MNEMNKIERICERCKISKALTTGNFKTTKIVGNYTRICRKCIDKEQNDFRNEKSKQQRAKRNLRIQHCENRDCNIVFETRNSRKMYCSKDCRSHEYNMEKQNSGIKVSNKHSKDIPIEFLERGKISGVHYR